MSIDEEKKIREILRRHFGKAPNAVVKDLCELHIRVWQGPKRKEAHEWLDRWIEGKTSQNLPANYDESRILDLGELHQALISARKEYLMNSVHKPSNVMKYNRLIYKYNTMEDVSERNKILFKALERITWSNAKLTPEDGIVLAMGGTMDDVRAKAREVNRNAKIS